MPPEMRAEEKVRIEKQILFECALKLRNNGVNVHAVEYQSVQSLVDNVGSAIVEVGEEKKKQVLTDISKKFKQRKLIGDSNEVENLSVETLVKNVDTSFHKVIKKASKAVLAIESSREENIEKSKIESKNEEENSLKIIEPTEDLSMYENTNSNILRRMKRTSSSESFNVIKDEDIDESFLDHE